MVRHATGYAAIVAVCVIIIGAVLTIPKFHREVKRLGEPSQQTQELRQEVERLKKLVPSDPPHSQLDDAYVKLHKGMTEEEALAALKSCGVDWRPNQVLSYTIDLDDGNGKTRQVPCKDMHWGEQHPSVVTDTPNAADYPNQHDYLLELHLHFADSKLYNADRMDWYKTRWNMLWRPPKNDEKK